MEKENKNIKEKLQEYLFLNESIEQLENELVCIESKVTKVTPCLSDLPKMQGFSDTLTENVAKMIDLQNLINKKLSNMYDLRNDLEQMICKLPTREQYLVRARYINRKTWEQIAVDMCYGWAQVHRIHSNALKILNEII